MVRKIFLIIAILGGLAAGGLNFAMIKDKIQGLQKNLADETDAKNKAQTELAKTKTDLNKTTAELKTTKDTLATTTQERDTAVNEAAAAVKKADGLATQLKDTKKTLEDTSAELAAFKATGFTPIQITGFGNEIKGLNAHIAAVEQENALVLHEQERLKNRLFKYEGTNYVVELDPNLRGKVMASDPKWNFVVVNVGSDQHALEDGELLVNRNGKLVAKIIITSAIQKDRCVANIMPGWELGEVMEGDLVIPAHPKSS